MNKLSILKKFFIPILVLTCVNLFFGLLVYQSVIKLNDNANMVNLAGKNRFMSQRVQGLILPIVTQDKSNISASLSEINQLLNQIENNISILKNGGKFEIEGKTVNIHVWDDGAINHSLNELSSEFSMFKSKINEFINSYQLSLAANENDSLLQKHNTERAKILTGYFIENRLLKLADNLVSNYNQKANENVASLLILLITVLVVDCILFLLFGIFFVKGFYQPLEELKHSLQSMLKGDLTKKAQKKYDDEIGFIAENLNNVIENSKQATDFATAIGQGQLDINYELTDKNDSLGISLLTMRDNLQKLAEEDRKRNWTTAGLAKFGDILRSSTDSFKDLADNIISSLVKYLEANQGSLFILQDIDKNDAHLELIACYAWDKKKYLNMRIDLGEGLIGQTWQEGETIYLTDVPNNFVRITSGLGDANPNCVVIVPLKLNEQIYGVIEIASFKTIQKHEVEFIEKLSENIASTISTAKVNERTKQLLEQSQQQAEEMRAQEEEMRQNMEEMAATQEELERVLQENHKQQAEIKARMDLINTTSLITESDLNGNLIYVNDKFCEVSKYSREELIGNSQYIVGHPDVPETMAQEVTDALANGQVYRNTIPCKAKDGSTFYVETVITPVLNDNGKPIKILNLLNDVTETYTQAAKMQAQANKIDKIITTLPDSLITTNANGDILTANPAFCELSQCVDKKLPNNITDVLPVLKLDKIEVNKKYRQKFVTLNKEPKMVNLVMQKITEGGVDSLVFVLSDITEMIKKDQEIIATLENLQQEKTKLQTHEEELRQNMEEMTATQEELQRVLLENEKQQAEIKARMGLINTTSLITESDLNGNLIYVNDKFCEVSKYSREELIGASQDILAHPDMPASIGEEVAAALAKGQVYKNTIPCKAKDGSTFYAETIITPVLDANGTPIKILNMLNDVTENYLKSAETKTQKDTLAHLTAEHKNKLDELASEIEMLNVQLKRKDKQIEELNNKQKGK